VPRLPNSPGEEIHDPEFHLPMFLRLRQLLEMVRFSHTLFALPFALLAAVMAWAANAGENPPVAFHGLDLVGILICMVTARSAAMAFNRVVDRRIDALNPRTRMRHLPRGVLTVGGVVAFTLICSAGFVGGTLLFLPRNWIPLAASAPVLAFLFGYSYAKRFTFLSHVWLGTALALAPLAAWVVLRAEIAWPPILLSGAVMLWVAGFDMIYACQDYEFDVSMHLHSVPARLGIAGALRVAALCHLVMLLLLAALPLAFPRFGSIWLAGVAAIAVLLAYEHWLVRPDDLSRVNQAFFHVNAVVSIGLLVIGALNLLL
jgi:4-hydroxybenzoate polyprenyltransferase